MHVMQEKRQEHLDRFMGAETLFLEADEYSRQLAAVLPSSSSALEALKKNRNTKSSQHRNADPPNTNEVHQSDLLDEVLVCELEVGVFFSSFSIYSTLGRRSLTIIVNYCVAHFG
jgi:hypothetical protein